MLILGNYNNVYDRSIQNSSKLALGAGNPKRGGSWINNPRRCRSAYRNNNAAGTRNNNIGFRVVSCVPSTLHLAKFDRWESIDRVSKSPDLFL